VEWQVEGRKSEEGKEGYERSGNGNARKIAPKCNMFGITVLIMYEVNCNGRR